MVETTALSPVNEVSLVWRRRDGRKSMVLGATADHVVGMDPGESRALHVSSRRTLHRTTVHGVEALSG